MRTFADVFPIAPESASTVAPQVDAVIYVLTAVSVFFTALIFALVVLFVVRYRRRSPEEAGTTIEGFLALELGWTIVPLIIALGMFAFSAKVFFHMANAPQDTLDVHVVGKQWMWKIQHPNGRREIDELHVPRGRPVRLLLASEDVIHSFFIPAFRVKMDAVPGRTTSLWFEATQVGTYHLFCTEYCGTDHSRMIGRVVVMEPDDYQRWLGGEVRDVSPVEAGAKLFEQYACPSCHRAAAPLAPRLEGSFGTKVPLVDGTEVVVDEEYLRESILNPMGKLHAGFAPIMPTFQGQLSEEGVQQLIAYIKSLGAPSAAAGAAPAAGTQP